MKLPQARVLAGPLLERGVASRGAMVLYLPGCSDILMVVLLVMW